MTGEILPWDDAETMPGQGGFGNIFEAATSLWRLEQAWVKVRSNKGCAGSDGVTIERFELRASQRLLGLSRQLRDGRYQPKRLRVFEIPKSSGAVRRLAVPSIIDRIAQTAVAQVLTPLIDPELSGASFAYRPGRSVQKAVAAVRKHRDAGFEWVAEGDIETFFDDVPHGLLLGKLEALLAEIQGGALLLDLIAIWLEAASSDLDARHAGIPQGSPLSPLLANLYLDSIDEAFEAHDRQIRLVRFADDFVILCRAEAMAERALEGMADLLKTHGLSLNPDKTRIVSFDRGFRFLGHLFVRSLIMPSKEDEPEDPASQLMREVAARDAQGEAAVLAEEEQRAAGLDPGLRILYLREPGRVLATRNAAFTVEERGIDKTRELLAVPSKMLDRVEIGPEAAVEEDAVRLALLTGAVIHHVNGQGDTVGITAAPLSDHAALHMAQAETALDPLRRLDLARRLVDGRIRNQRALLHRLNRRRRLGDVLDTTRKLGRVLRKLPVAPDVAALLGHEGEAAASYWPALAKLVQPRWAVARGRFKRQRHPAPDALNIVLNYLASLLTRDAEVLARRHGLHPGFGILHASRDGHDACVYDLIEAFRAPLAEGLAVYLFNNRMLDEAMFGPRDDGQGMRLKRSGHGAIIGGYQERMTDTLKSPRDGRNLTWRRLLEEETVAFAQHCRHHLPGREVNAYKPYAMDY